MSTAPDARLVNYSAHFITSVAVKDRQLIGVNKAKLEKMKDDYYQLMGLDVKTGMPSRASLEKLNMLDVADKLGL